MHENSAHRTCNKPRKQEAVQYAVKWIGLNVLVITILTLVTKSLQHTGQVLDDAEAASDDEVDRYIALVWAVVQEDRSYSKQRQLRSALVRQLLVSSSTT